MLKAQKYSKKYKQNSLTLFHSNCPIATPTIPPNFQPVWRQAGFEPVPLAWQASALPLGYLPPRSERLKKLICHNFWEKKLGGGRRDSFDRIKKLICHNFWKNLVGGAIGQFEWKSVREFCLYFFGIFHFWEKIYIYYKTKDFPLWIGVEI